MPKERSSPKSASEENRYHAYKHHSRHGKGHNVVEEDKAESSGGKKDWEDATCPICMDYPHNAVLLFCSSHDKGCRPYVCNTSHRHSNCLDQYRKANSETQKTCVLRELSPEISSGQLLTARVERSTTSMNLGTSRRSRRNVVINGAEGGQTSDFEAVLLNEDDHTDESEHSAVSSTFLKADSKGLICPLCRGKVKGWKVVNLAREHLNHKVRNCAQESCLFSGNYGELRVHARCEHPLARPSEIDPVRQRDWRRLERRRDLDDVFSTIQSAGATVMRDLMIEEDMEDVVEGMDFPGDEGHWWTVLLLFEVFGPATSVAVDGMDPPFRRSHGRVPRRGHWGESLSHNGNMENDSSLQISDSEEQARRSSRRQRSCRPRRTEG